jgi:hypothetical protein
VVAVLAETRVRSGRTHRTEQVIQVVTMARAQGSRYGQADIEAARLAASEVCAKRRREPAERDRHLEKLAIEVLTALGERDATTIAATEQRGRAL